MHCAVRLGAQLRHPSSLPGDCAPAAGTPYRKGQRYYFSHNSGLQNQYVVSAGARDSQV